MLCNIQSKITEVQSVIEHGRVTIWISNYLFVNPFGCVIIIKLMFLLQQNAYSNLERADFYVHT